MQHAATEAPPPPPATARNGSSGPDSGEATEGIRCTVMGAGSWGTALAIHLARRGHEVLLWSRDRSSAGTMQRSRCNARYLPDVRFPDNLAVTHDLREATSNAALYVVAVPTQSMRAFLLDWRPYLPETPIPMVSASKGIERGTLAMVLDMFRESLDARWHPQIAHLSGPSFAAEVAHRKPTAVCLATRSAELGEVVIRHLHDERFRVYLSEDEVGVELGGALKNVVALAVGCSDGLGFGVNARAALITRGLAEITRLAVTLGAQSQTLAGLSGLGDLLLTCTGDLSRNRQVGMRIGRGESLASIRASMSMVAEGVATAESANALADKHGVDMPIAREVYRVLYEGKHPADAVQSLLLRPWRRELDARDGAS